MEWTALLSNRHILSVMLYSTDWWCYCEKMTKICSSFAMMLTFLLHPGSGAGYCDQFVCLSVCLSVREHTFGTAGPIFMNFLCRAPVAVARSSSGGVTIRYVLLVLRMTSRLAVMGRMAMRGRLNLWPTTTSGIAIPGQSLMSVNALFTFEVSLVWQFLYCGQHRI